MKNVLKKLSIVLVVIFVLLVAVNFIPSKKVTDKNVLLEAYAKNGILVMAEKGGYVQNPANTRKAFDAIIQTSSGYYVDIVELDVRTSKDGVLVIIEDESINKAAGLAEDAEEIKVSEHTYQELKKYNLGASFVNLNGDKPYESSTNFSNQGLAMISFEDFLTRYQSNRYTTSNRVYYVVDFQETGEAGQAAVKKAVDLLELEKYNNYDERVFFSTTDKALLNHIDDNYGKYLTVGAGNYTRPLVSALKFGYRQLVTPKYEIVQMNIKEEGLLGIKWNVAKRSFMNKIEEKNMVIIYTGITTEAEIKKLYGFEAHVISSGYPKLIDTTIKAIESEENK